MAPRRNVKVHHNVSYNNLTTSDVICPICRDILIKPITLPCNHGFCASCFEVSTQNADLACPSCRTRISSWMRSATKSKKLINESLWKAIQEFFPSQVKTKLINSRPVTEGKNGNAAVKNAVQGARSKISESLIKKLQVGELQFSLNQGKLHTNLKLTNECTLSYSKPTIITDPHSIINKAGNECSPPRKVEQSRNNFATKEYTCRILCQNVSTNGAAKKITCNESAIQGANLQLQKIFNTYPLQDRSNSIESECLYFKPIDYRHNPPSAGLTPIKVPTKKPPKVANVVIVAPCGQNKIMTSLKSAFVKLSSPIINEKNVCQEENTEINTTIKDCKEAITKRKNNSLPEINSKKKLKNSKNEMVLVINNNKCSSPAEVETITQDTNQNSRKNARLVAKKMLQEKQDFEMATKLQKEFDDLARYSTRSRAPRSGKKK